MILHVWFIQENASSILIRSPSSETTHYVKFIVGAVVVVDLQLPMQSVHISPLTL